MGWLRTETHLNHRASVRYVCQLLTKIGIESNFNKTLQYQKSRKPVQPSCGETDMHCEAIGAFLFISLPTCQNELKILVLVNILQWNGLDPVGSRQRKKRALVTTEMELLVS